MNKRVEEKGITLIALIITIIVLLILAGVAIATLTGDNGILTKANDAKIQTDEAGEKEAIGIAYNGAIAETQGETVTADILQTELKGNGYTTAAVTGEGKLTIKGMPSGNTYIIAQDGKVAKYVPPKVTEATTHTATQLTYSWSELGEIADSIASSSEITNDTVEVEVDGKTIGVGDWLTISYGTDNVEKKVRILGFNHDYIANSDGTASTTHAGISFEFVTSLGTRQMNSTATNTGGWAGSEMKEALSIDSNYFSNLPSELQSEIVAVSKEGNKGYSDTPQFEKTATSEKLWLLSYYEVCGSSPSYGDGKTETGPRYAYYATNTTGMIKYSTCTDGIDATACWWWLRSPGFGYSNYFIDISSGGGSNYEDATVSTSVLPGFSI